MVVCTNINMTETDGKLNAKVLDFLDRQGFDKVVHLPFDLFQAAMLDETLRPRMAGRRFTAHNEVSRHWERVKGRVLLAPTNDLDAGVSMAISLR